MHLSCDALVGENVQNGWGVSNVFVIPQTFSIEVVVWGGFRGKNLTNLDREIADASGVPLPI